LGEVTCLVALPALNAFSRAWLLPSLTEGHRLDPSLSGGNRRIPSPISGSRRVASLRCHSSVSRNASLDESFFCLVLQHIHLDLLPLLHHLIREQWLQMALFLTYRHQRIVAEVWVRNEDIVPAPRGPRYRIFVVDDPLLITPVCNSDVKVEAV
jgi:hypothetical protein